MEANGTEITDFEGTGLNIDSNNILNVTGSNLGSGAKVFADQTGTDLNFRSLVGGSNVSLDLTSSDEIEVTATDTDTRTNVSDDGDEVAADVADINFASELNVSDDGDGSVTVDGTSVSPWEDTDTDGLLEAPEFDGIEAEDVQSPEQETLRIESDADLVLSLSGEQGAVRIETPGGRKVVLDDQDGSESISIEDSTGNSIKMDSTTDEISISANEKISFDAPQIDIAADTVLNVESDGILDIDSSGPTTIEGAVISLNGGTFPAARVGDPVDVDLETETGTISTGSTTVFIG